MVAISMTGVVGLAVGQPADDAPPVTAIGWQQLGINPQISLVGDDVTQRISIPVPPGLSPITFSGLLSAVNNIPSGFIEAQTVDGRFVGSVPIPNIPPGQPPAPFTFDIASVPVMHREVQLNLILRVDDTDDVCEPLPTLVMTDISATFTGAVQSPTTIEEFLPVVAPVIDLYVDPAPTDAEKSTVLRLVAALTKHYQPATVTTNVLSLPRMEAGPPPDRDPSVRAIVIRDVDEPEAGVRLVTDAGPPYLLMAGRGEALARQPGLFRDGLQKVAQTGTVTVESAETAPGEGAATATFEQLRIGGSTSVMGESYIFLNIAPALSTSAEPGIVDVRLLANYTPVEEVEKGTMVVAAGDVVLTTVRLDASGRVDNRFSIPADVAARDQDLTVTIRYEPGPGCTPITLPMKFEIDPMSTATVRPGGAVEMGGFAALPQGFIPKFQVALDGSDPDELAHAAKIIGSIQRLTTTALNPELVGIDQAATSDTSALVIASAQTVEEKNLNPPITPKGGRSEVDLPASVVVDISTGLAALQSYAQNGRTIVLLAASGPWTLATPLFDYLAGLPQGWRNLSGDVLVVGQGLVPRELTVRTDGPVMAGSHGVNADAVEQESDTRGWYEWTLLGAGVLVILTLIGATIVLLRKRSRPSASVGPQS